jgi:hypothetical protein
VIGKRAHQNIQILPVWWFRSRIIGCRDLATPTSEPKPHWINILPVSFDSQVRDGVCCNTLRTSESGQWPLYGEWPAVGQCSGRGAAKQMTDLSWDESTPSVLEKRPEIQDGLETIQ